MVFLPPPPTHTHIVQNVHSPAECFVLECSLDDFNSTFPGFSNTYCTNGKTIERLEGHRTAGLHPRDPLHGLGLLLRREVDACSKKAPTASALFWGYRALICVVSMVEMLESPQG